MGRCVVCSASENPEIQSDFSVVDNVDKNIRMYVLTTQEEICSECYSAIQENLYEKKKNTQVENELPCTDCGSSDALTVYQDSEGMYFSKCFSCDATHQLGSSYHRDSVPKPSGPRIFRKQEPLTEVYMDWEGIKAGTFQKYMSPLLVNSHGTVLHLAGFTTYRETLRPGYLRPWM